MNETYIEKNKRLSKSLLWELQKSAYTQFGPNAWSTKQVPFYLTSNPLIARQYAQVVLAYFRDGLKHNSIDLQEPLYILDLGAGTGRFAYLFLCNLKEMLTNLQMPFKIRYVMTDIAEANMQYWSQHPYFQRFFKEGCLDYAYYLHSDQSTVLDLLHSGLKLTPENLRNPLTVIGNYFFDTIPQDIFCIKDHILYEGLISLSSHQGLPSHDPAIIPHLNYHLDYVPLENIDELDLDTDAKQTLTNYAKTYANLPFLIFPTGAFQVISHFRKFSNDRVLFLTGDQGITENQSHQEIPFFAKHDTFSMLVNYHVLDSYFKILKGFCILTPSISPEMVNMAAIASSEGLDFPEVREAFRLTLAAFEPQDYFKLIQEVSQSENLSLTFMLKLIKWGLDDPLNFNLFFPHIREKLARATQIEKTELAMVIDKCWKAFFPVNQAEGAFVMNLGVLFFEMQKYDEAIRYFQYALEIGYTEPHVYQNITAAQMAKRLFS